MVGLNLTYAYLYWRKPSGPPPAPPDGIGRFFIKTPDGDLELLFARPQQASGPGVVFVHGGMGSAWVWVPYMRFLAAHGVPCYAISLRGHGNSWHPSFFRMTFCTSISRLADDVRAAIRLVRKREARGHVILVGHSSGGGLCQYLLNHRLAKAQGLALLSAVPGTGSFKVYRNWAVADPWFLFRMILHGWHSNSPLSHPALVRNIFFSDTYPDSELAEFQSHSNRYESFLWPFSMICPFVDAKNVIQQGITGWRSSKAPRMLIMAGTHDKLMTSDVQIQSAETYRAAFSELVSKGSISVEDSEVDSLSDGDNTGHGICLAWVPGAAHHLQNDVGWEVGARKLLQFLQQL